MLQGYHPRSLVIYLAIWFVLALFINDLRLLALMLLLIIMINLAEGGGRALIKMFKIVLPLALLIMILNLLIVDYGSNVLYVLDLPGRFSWTIYQEPLFNSLAMAIKLLLIMGVFVVFNRAVTVDRLVSVFGSWSGTTVLLAVLAARMVPATSRQARSIAEVQSLRLPRPKRFSLVDKVKKTGPFLTNLLRASLESSLKTAEAMQIRAYGSGQRTYFVPEYWQRQDTFITVMAVGLFIIITLGIPGGTVIGLLLLLSAPILGRWL